MDADAIEKAAEREGNMIKLSIIVPVFNLENCISRTLDSLLSIRFSHDYEIVVVNDGSTDGSEAVIAGYQEKSDKIRLFTIENGGVSNARNVGIRHAQGQYITFMDGDDTVEPDFYEKAVAELDAGGYDFVQGNYREVYEDRVISCIFAERDVEITDRKEMLERYLDQNKQLIHYGVWGKVFQADTVRQICFDRTLSVAEDQKFVFDVLCVCGRIKLLADISINYFQRGSSAYHTLSSDKIQGKLAVLAHFRQNTPYQELLWMIDYRRVFVLQELYFHLCRERDPRAKEVRREILKCPVRQLWPRLTTSARRRILLHRFAGPLYDLYFMYLKK